MTFTYEETGRTRDGDLPAGYRHVRRDAVIGRGDGAFDRVAAGMREWQIHRLAGLLVRGAAVPEVGGAPEVGAPEVGAEFSAGLGVGRLRLWVPCRVVWVRAAPDAYGYGFGTVPGHPERGEEAFEVTRDGDGTVRFCIRAFSRPGSWYAKLGGPITTLLQDHVTDRYVRGARLLAQPQ